MSEKSLIYTDTLKKVDHQQVRLPFGAKGSTKVKTRLAEIIQDIPNILAGEECRDCLASVKNVAVLQLLGTGSLAETGKKGKVMEVLLISVNT